VSSWQYRKAHWTTYQDLERRRWRTGRPYRTWRDGILRPAVLWCCRCGQLIDKRLKYPHPGSGEADHFPVPLSRWIPDGRPPPGAPAHRRCNLSAQNRMPGEVPRHVAAVADRRW
jgi:hypothetical protein